MMYNDIDSPIATKGFRLNEDETAVGLNYLFAGGVGAADLGRLFYPAPGFFVLLVATQEVG